MTDELEDEALELAGLAEPPSLPGAPEWMQANMHWHYTLERERRLGEIRRRAVYETERRDMKRVLADTQALAAQMAEVGITVTRAIADLKEDVHGVKREIAKLARRVQGQGDTLAELAERVDEMEHELESVKLEIARIVTRDSPTLPPEPIGLTDPGEPK